VGNSVLGLLLPRQEFVNELQFGSNDFNELIYLALTEQSQNRILDNLNVTQMLGLKKNESL
jgi:hypothetical protein